MNASLILHVSLCDRSFDDFLQLSQITMTQSLSIDTFVAILDKLLMILKNIIRPKIN